MHVNNDLYMEQMNHSVAIKLKINYFMLTFYRYFAVFRGEIGNFNFHFFKCNEQPSQATETPSVEKHAHPPRVVYCAIYLTLTLITKFRVSHLHITTR